MKKARTLVLLAAMTVLWSVFALSQNATKAQDKKPAAQPAPATAAAPEMLAKPVADDAYRIGIEDDLIISVWHETELSVQVVVRPDGVITMPLVNDIQVVGLTTQQLATLITDKLKPFVNEPQVTVLVKSIRSRKVFLMGQVARTGAVPLNSRRTVMELIAEAGGLGPYAKAGSIYVIRNSNGKPQKIPFNYKEAIKGNLKSNFEVLPGDIIVVP